MKKIDIIYIVGYNHSGTTLISKCLGISKNAFNIGELNHFRESYEKKANKITKEGFTVKDSPFWKPITEKIDYSKLHPISIPLRKKISLLLRILLGLKINNFNIKEEERLYECLIDRAIQFKHIDKNEKYYLIESSKSLFRLISLIKSEKINFKILHVVRDIRGVGNSHKKRGEHCFLKMIECIITNLAIKKFLNKNNINYYTLVYEEFAKNPSKYFKYFNDKFELKLDYKNYINSLNLEEDYTFSGNPMRKKKIHKISIDNEWKKNFTGVNKIIANSLHRLSKIILKY